MDMEVFAGVGGMKWPHVDCWVQKDSVQAALEHEKSSKARCVLSYR